MIAEISKDKKSLVITTPLFEPRLSGSGKTKLVANERTVTNVMIEGKPVQVQISAFIKEEKADQ